MQICLKIGHPQFRISSFSPVNCNIGIHHISGQSQINVMLMLQFINCIHIPLISPNIHINWFVLIVSSPNPPKLITRQKNKCDHTFFQKIKQKSPKYIPHTSSMDRKYLLRRANSAYSRPHPSRPIRAWHGVTHWCSNDHDHLGRLHVARDFESMSKGGTEFCRSCSQKSSTCLTKGKCRHRNGLQNWHELMS